MGTEKSIHTHNKPRVMGNASSSENVGRDVQYGTHVPVGRSLDAPEVDDDALPTGIVAMLENRGVAIRMAYPPESEIPERSTTLELILSDFQRDISQELPDRRFRIRARRGTWLLLGVSGNDLRLVFGIMIRVLYSYGYTLESKDLDVYVFVLAGELLDRNKVVDVIRDGGFDRTRIETAGRVIDTIESTGFDDLSRIIDAIEQDDATKVDVDAVRRTLDDGEPQELEAAQDQLIDELIDAGPSELEDAAALLRELGFSDEKEEEEEEDDFDFPPLFDAKYSHK